MYSFYANNSRYIRYRYTFYGNADEVTFLWKLVQLSRLLWPVSGCRGAADIAQSTSAHWRNMCRTSSWEARSSRYLCKLQVDNKNRYHDNNLNSDTACCACLLAMLDFQWCRALVKVDEISESIERTANKDLLVFAEKYLLLLKNI